MDTLSSRLTACMAAKQLRPIDLARIAGVKPPSVSDWISGKTKSIKGENLLKISRALNVDPTWLSHGIGNNRTLDNIASEPTAKYSIEHDGWPFKRINKVDYYEYLDVFQRSEIEGYISGLIASKKKSMPG